MFFKKKEKQPAQPTIEEIVLQKKNAFNDLIALSAFLNAQNDAKNEQARCDFQKWIESERKKCDLSGKMSYCAFCDYCRNDECIAEQKNRVENTLCASASKKYYQELQHENAKDYCITTPLD